MCAETATGTLDIFGEDHGAMGFGNVCVNANTNMTSGSATLTLDGPPGSVQAPANTTVPLDANGDGSGIWRVFDPNATYTVDGSAEGNLGTFTFQPLSLPFTDVNSQGRGCGPQ